MFGQSYCFWEFTNTDLKYILIASCGTNCDMGVERILTSPPQHLQLLLETCVFFRSGLRACYGVAWKRMVLPKQLKKMKLTSFEFSLLDKVRMSSRSNILRPSQWDHQKKQNALGPNGFLPPVRDLQLQSYDLWWSVPYIDAPRLTKEMERCKTKCGSGERSQQASDIERQSKEVSHETFPIWHIHQRRTFCEDMLIVPLSFSYRRKR